MELLSPAGNMEALIAAVQNGADAVYLGCSALSARASAGFSPEELRQAVSYAHLRSVRVYVTVNTLVFENELEKAKKLIGEIRDAKADAVLIQDIGAARLISRLFPDVNMHASTQMAIHNRAGVRFAKSIGMTRAVLARECSMETVAECAKEGLEIEVFVHGAHCVAMSGQCLFSSMVGNRSGNRGRCAQPCRMKYSIDGLASGYLLSPRDLCMIRRVPELLAAGVSSLKIEGRLKRAEYVAVVTRAYRQAIDAALSGKAYEPDENALLQVFNRGGFTQGYLAKKSDADIIYPEKPNHEGTYLGKTLSCQNGIAKVLLQKPLSNGDGLQFRHESEQDVIYSGKDALGGETALIRVRENVKPNIPVWKLDDERQLKQARESYFGETKSVKVDFALRAFTGEKIMLSASDGKLRAVEYGEVLMAAQSRCLDCESAEKAISKTGGTVFEYGSLKFEGDNAFCQVSAINKLRRDVLSELSLLREEAFYLSRPAAAKPMIPVFSRGKIDISAMLHVKSSEISDAENIGENSLFCYCPRDYTIEALEKAVDDERLKGSVFVFPMEASDMQLHALCRFVNERAELFSAVMLENVSQLMLDFSLPVIAGQGIPVTNVEAANALGDFKVSAYVASPEMSNSQRNSIASPIPQIVKCYGRERLMHLRHCPVNTAMGRKSHESCRLCESGKGLVGKELTDRRGYRFPLMSVRLDDGCRVILLNSAVTSIRADKRGNSRLAELTCESDAERKRVISALERGEAPEVSGATSGHEKRPLE
ncbi:MAG: U32 family peptidase [Eubacteriales bacterium]|nr:U32 family peptidase [Eubacteriales bacterium]MDD4512473.1 U32 family peptidase [Eubacteriales bacterium]